MKKLIALFIFLVFADTQGVELPAGTVTVKAYLFDCTLGTADPKSGTPLLDKEFNLSKGIIGKPVKLNDEQIKNFLIAFDKGSAFSAAAGCHVPHHGLFFFDKEGKAIGYYEICFGCGNVGTSVKHMRGVYIDLRAVKDLMKELGFPIFKHFKDYSQLYNQQKK